MWPEYASFSDNPWNLVRLNYINHVLAHYYFSKATNRLWRAVRLMLIGINPSRQIAVKRLTDDEIKCLASVGSETRGLLKIGKPMSDSHKSKIQKSLTGYKQSPEHSMKAGLTKLGKPLSTDHRKQLSVSHRKGPHWPKYDELYDLWLNSGQFKSSKFKSIAISNGYPDVDYKGMVNIFMKQISQTG